MNEADQSPPPSEFFISTDDSYLDLDWLIPTIQSQYWATWRSHETVRGSIDASLNFGLYRRLPFNKHQQVGFARVVGDATTFSWICDVIVEGKLRGQGLGAFLMQTIMAHPAVAKTVMLLRTRDQQKFYGRFGFEKVEAMRKMPAP